jgi:hypothetical protein
MEAEYKSLIRQKEEALSLVEKLNVDEKRRLEIEKEKLAQEYQSKLEAERHSHAASEAQYKEQLSAAQQQRQASEAELSSTMAVLAHQHASETAQLASLRIPEEAFGAKAWKDYFGVEVGVAPPLPADIDEILNSPCPFWKGKTFWRGKQVKDTHLLVLVPATVDGRPFTLDLLGDLIKSPQGSGSKTQYRYYDGGTVQKELGAQSPGSSYWVLMTRDVLPDSRSKTYDAQKALVAAHASKLGLPYEMPHVLEAATAILLHHARTGERLYTDAPWTYTRCQEKVVNNMYPPVVGGFSSEGLDVYSSHVYYHYHGSHVGVSCLRKF